MTRIRLKYLHLEIKKARDGSTYDVRYVRIGKGPRKRIDADFGTPEFLAEYTRLRGDQSSQGKIGPRAGTLGAFLNDYISSPEFAELSESTRNTRRRLVKGMLLEPIAPNSEITFANVHLDELTIEGLKVLRDRKKGPAAGNDRLKLLKAAATWGTETTTYGAYSALSRGLFHLVRRRRYEKTTHRKWTDEEKQKYESRHPPGTLARLAYEIGLLGFRVSDMISFGRQHINDGVIVKRLVKRNSRLERPEVSFTAPREFLDVLSKSSVGELTFLVTKTGRPFSEKMLGIYFRKWRAEAGLSPEVVPHGLRTTAAVNLAERGATAPEIMAVMGWKDIKLAEHYIQGANKTKLGRRGGPLLSRKES